MLLPEHLATRLALATLALLPSVILAESIPVVVGGLGVLRFTPEYVNASIGDEIVFIFEQDNHTVTQSTFDSPCSVAAGGFDSGFVVVPDSVDVEFPTARIPIKGLDPIWVFCGQTGACQSGMVFAVNPAGQYEEFQAKANATKSSVLTNPEGTFNLTVATLPPPSTVTETLSASGETFTTTYESYPGSVEPTQQASANHVVKVGESGLTYTPSNITAQPGDTVTFQFFPEAHTVTQSTFNNPCVPLEGGFDSGIIPVDTNATTNPEYTITINDTTPIYGYCAQKGHCGLGMVFTINAVEPEDFTIFQEVAIAINGTETTTATSSAASSSTSSSGSDTGSGSGSTCKRSRIYRD